MLRLFRLERLIDTSVADVLTQPVGQEADSSCPVSVGHVTRVDLKAPSLFVNAFIIGAFEAPSTLIAASSHHFSRKVGVL